MLTDTIEKNKVITNNIRNIQLLIGWQFFYWQQQKIFNNKSKYNLTYGLRHPKISNIIKYVS